MYSVPYLKLIIAPSPYIRLYLIFRLYSFKLYIENSLTIDPWVTRIRNVDYS